MIRGLGIDLTELSRIKAAQERNSHFAEKVLTSKELAAYSALEGQRALEYLAGRFSVKEAYAKAYGTGLGKVALQDVETLTGNNGQPVITKHPATALVHVSISHTAELVMTEVVLED